MRSRRAIVAVAVATVAVSLTIVAHRSTTTALPRVPVLGPARDVYDGDVGDPFVLAAAGGYWMFGTGDWPARVPTAYSSDLVHWQAAPDAMPVLPGWAAADPDNALTWAPAVLATAHGFMLYITVPDAATRRQCIAVEASAVPGGPYHDASNGPLVCQAELGGSIDPMVVREPGGQLHLLWKNDGNCCGLTVSLWSQDLDADGLGLTGQPHRLLSADQPWEGGVIERPVATPAAHGGWWLFHAGNDFELAAYATGVAYCPTLAGPCHDAGAGPFLATEGRQYSPGGVDPFTDLSGTRWVVYAIWNRPSRNGRFYCCRSVQLARVVST